MGALLHCGSWRTLSKLSMGRFQWYVFIPPLKASLPGDNPACADYTKHFDGGIRRGSDIFKALCLGADMVWIGRPILWGLAYDGQHGVANALSVLQEEFQQCMGLAGCITLEDLCPERLMAVDSKL